MIIIIMLGYYVNLLTISRGPARNRDQLYQHRYSLLIYADEYYKDGFNDRLLCEDIHNAS
jgi:hypothetical protein